MTNSTTTTTAATNLPEPHYSMLIEWSDDDQAFLVTLPEWGGRVNTPTTHGATYEEAASNGREALADLIAIAQERGYPVPTPRIRASA